MGFSFHGRRRDVDAEKHLKRLHKTTPFIESPLQGADHAHLVFSQRHEANTVELFFDLFFVANLATFTTYHSVTDHFSLLAYVGFFGILWSSWFQITLHDVRFARDSIYERACKTVQFIVFVGLALVGSAFNPGSSKGTNTNFRILCYTLVISRVLLALQYAIVLMYTIMARYSKLFLPIGLMIAIYAAGAIAFGAMIPAFQEEENDTHHAIYVVWYVIMFIEAVAVIGISCIWRMLSFKKTHLMERMSLLTLIVIGEGAIGVSKTVSRIMGKSGLEVEGCFLIMCIIVILVFVWALYFDNFPHGHYGTIRQQFWSLLHFPFQLAIVGVVEGSQQLAIARYVLRNYGEIAEDITSYCVDDNLSGPELRDKLIYMVEYWDLGKKLETIFFEPLLLEHAYNVGNQTDICSVKHAKEYEESGKWPLDIASFMSLLFDGVYAGLGIKIPTDKLEVMNAIDVAESAWKLTYMYYWISFCVLLICLILFLVLIRHHRRDLFDVVSIVIRFVVLVVGGVLASLMANKDALHSFLSSPAILPTCVVLLFLILIFDKISAVISNWNVKNSGKPYAKPHAHEEGDHHVPHTGAGDQIDSPAHHPYHAQHAHHASLASLDNRKSAWSLYDDTQPLTSPGTDFERGSQMFHMSPMMSPPPPRPNSTHAAGGYSPLGSGRDLGA